MSGFIGADVEQLRALARMYDAQSATLDSAANTIDVQLATSTWAGIDADEFRGYWSTLRTSLTNGAQALRGGAERLQLNADEQDSASAGDGSGAGTGSGAGPATASGGTFSAEGSVGRWGTTEGGLGQKPKTTGTVKTDRYDGADKKPISKFEFSNKEFGASDVKNHLGGASASGGLGLKGEVSGEWGDAAGWHADAKAEGWAGVRGDVGFGVTQDAAGKFEAKAGASAAVGAGGKASATGGYGILEGTASAEAFAGARAGVNGSVSYGPEGLGAKLGGEAFAGAEASATVSGGIKGAQGSVTGEVYAGIGVRANADIKIGADRITADVKLGAALGIGGGISFKVDIQPKKIVDGILGVFGW